ncbi:MBL fold metallo-hydrolase [Fulvivirga sp. M361]|uniref:MBL fold metallo-hydrolase n=1 Tax=Fulvivirga sp. M361 TaxID=2594266 RepID=UPI001179DA7E|nr:MBL fold metallo-hydrolase [Fulvivirga sp. M361]TRX48926.1 MBL fold metallo-hydrolase [Fulvivirga sp. M361]
MSTTLQFLGATKQVTGSKFLLETHGLRILVDCGMDMEQRDDELSQSFHFNPKSIDVLLLTHAHIDHSGLIPLLVKEGFEGQIYCTYATYHLTEILLFDIARINLKKAKSRKKRFRIDFYGPREVEDCLDYFQPIDVEQKTALNQEVSFYFRTAGHLLGAAHIVVEAGEKTIVFSGDVGRSNYPLLKNPVPVPVADYIICETTYGMRVHQDKNPEKIIGKIIHDSCVAVPGRLIIPSFSVGRTQTLLYILHKLQVAGNLPPIKIFTDSPLARKSTHVYQDFAAYLNSKARHFQDEQGSLFNFDNLFYMDDMNSAEEIDNYNEPCIIITSSGMVKGGKSEDHVFRNLKNSYCTLLFIGYCSEGTLGRQLMDGVKTFRRNGQIYNVSARVLSTDVLSGHGDFNNLMDFFKTQDKQRLQKVFLVHGDEDAMQNFKESLEHQGVNKVIIPEFGERISLSA